MSRQRTENGYPLPIVVNPDGRRCVQLLIPDEPAHVRAFWGALFELARWHNWERDALKQGSEAAAVWKPIILEAMSGFYDHEGCEMDVRQNPGNPCILERSTDGSTWVEFADISLCRRPDAGAIGRYVQQADGSWFYEVPDGEMTYSYAPGDDARFYRVTSQTSDRCLRATRMTAWLNGVLIDAIDATVAGGETVGGVALGILGAAIFLGPFALLAGAAAAAATGITLGVALQQAQQLQGAQQDILCAMFDTVASTTTPGATEYNDLLSRLRSKIPTPLQSPLLNVLEIVGSAGLARAADLAIYGTVAADCTPCIECDFEETMAVNSNGTVSTLSIGTLLHCEYEIYIFGTFNSASNQLADGFYYSDGGVWSEANARIEINRGNGDGWQVFPRPAYSTTGYVFIYSGNGAAWGFRINDSYEDNAGTLSARIRGSQA